MGQLVDDKAEREVGVIETERPEKNKARAVVVALFFLTSLAVLPQGKQQVRQLVAAEIHCAFSS